MRIAFILPVLLLGFAPASDDLATRYEAGKAVRIETRTSFQLHTEVRLNGVLLAGGGNRVEEVSFSVVVDSWLECAAGRPVRVRRSFEEIGGQVDLTFHEESRSLAIESPFEEMLVELARDDEDGLVRRVVEGEAPADESIEMLRLELDLDALLPEGEVDVGADWDLDGVAIRRALGFEVASVLFPRPQEVDVEHLPGEVGPQRPLFEAEWSGSATYSGTGRRDGEICCIIELELEGTHEIKDEDGARGTCEVRIEGKLFLSVEARRPTALELEGTLWAESYFEEGEGNHEWKLHSISSGSFEQTVSIESTGFEPALSSGSIGPRPVHRDR